MNPATFNYIQDLQSQMRELDKRLSRDPLDKLAAIKYSEIYKTYRETYEPTEKPLFN
jgi:hypothetical protein